MEFFHRQRLLVFLLLIPLLTILVGKIVWPQSLRAQSNPQSGGLNNNIGTNIGEGDVGWQLGILDFIHSQGVGDGYPITFLVFAKDTTQDQLNQVEAKLHQYHFFPMIVVSQPCLVDSTAAANFVQMVENTYHKDYKDGEFLIEFGNEIDNKTAGNCKDWSAYVANWNAVKGFPNIAPSTINAYKPTYEDAPGNEGFWTTPGIADIYSQSAPTRTANSYGCLDSTSYNQCSQTNNFGTYTRSYSADNHVWSPPQTLFLTEFGLNPAVGTGVTFEQTLKTAPDSNIPGVIQFIQQNAPKVFGSTNTKKITPLVRNICFPENGDGLWALYINGKVFTRSGIDISDGICQKHPPYFEYNIHRADPAKLLNNFDQYYSVACMPQEDFHIGYENNDKCSDPNYYCPPGWDTNWNVNGSLAIDVNGKMFGLFRDEKKVTARIDSGNFPARNESIEGYLSAKNVFQSSSTKTDFLATNTQPSVSDLTDTNVNQAPLYKLTTLEEQCNFAMQKLKAVRELCDASQRIEGQANDPCGLDQKIPNTSYSHIDLLNSIGSRTCPDLMDPTKTDTQTLKLRQAILSVNPAMETAYRPAFIVAVTTFDGTNALQNPGQNITVNMGKPDDVNNQTGKFTVVDYMEVKVPAFASDFAITDSTHPENTSSDPMTYRDPLTRTADVLRTTSQRDAAASEEKTIRNSITQNSQNPPPSVIGGGNVPVFCYNNGQFGKCDPANDDKLPPTLVQFINAYGSSVTGATPGYPALPCDVDEKDFFNKHFYSDATKQKIAEQARTIGADLQAQDFPAATENILKVKRKKNLTINLAVNIKKIPDNSTPATHTRLYFVSPYNYNLKYAQQSFLNFLTQDQQKYLESLGVGAIDSTTQQFALDQQKFSPLSKNPIGDALNGSSPNGVATQIAPPTIPPATIPLIGKLMPNTDDSGQSKSHSILLELAGQVASLPTRLMALLTTPVHSALNDYTLACAHDPNDPTKPNPYATEDWLLGRCKAKPTQACTQPASAPNVSNFGQNGFLTTVNVTAGSFITSTPSEYGQKSCDWANGKGLAVAINANFAHDSHSPYGPFGFGGNIFNFSNGDITNTPWYSGINAARKMSLVVDKSGAAHVYDWSDASGSKADINGVPDPSQTDFIVTGVYYDDFQDVGTLHYRGVEDRTAVGLKGNQLYILSIPTTPPGMRDAMATLGIDEGHFVMLDSDSPSQLCVDDGSGKMVQKFPDPTNPDIIAANYPVPVAVSMGIKGGGTCNGTSTGAPTTPTQPGAGGACMEVFPSADKVAQYASELKQNLPNQISLWNDFYPEKTYDPLQGPQHLFMNSCGGQLCYNTIIDRSVAAGINPYVTIAIALHEDGGLRSNLPDASNLKHFGCDVFQPTLPQYTPYTIENKMNCMLDTLVANKSKSSDDIMSTYGYSNGAHNESMLNVIGLLSNGTYQGTCQ